MALAPIDEALKRIRRGEMVLVVDDEDRENEGDLTMAASWVTAEAINFMLAWARRAHLHAGRTGRARRARPRADGRRPRSPAATRRSPSRSTTSTRAAASAPPTAPSRSVACVDARRDARRLQPSRPRVPAARATRAACSSGAATPRPPSTSPVLAGLPPVAVTCEVLDDDGAAASFDVLVEFAAHHRIAMVSVDQIVEHRKADGAESRRPALLL